MRIDKLDPAVLRKLERSELPPAVVVGTDVTGLTVARALSCHGVPVLGVDGVRRRFTSYSGSLHFISVRDFYGPGFIGALEELAAALPRKAALFLSMDEHVKLVGAHGQHLRELYQFRFPEPDTVDLLMNKRRFSQLAERRGWPIPLTRYCSSTEDVGAASAELRFPVILKPELKNQAFRENTPQKAFRCETPAELRDAYLTFAGWEPEAVIQEWVPGRDDAIRFTFHYLDDTLREICAFEGRKLRQWIPECGSTSLAIGVERPELLELSRDILRQTRCVGLGAVEYKQDARDGSFKIMEPTVGRPNLQVGVAVANGVNTIARAYFEVCGLPYPVTEPVTWNRKWVLTRSDWKSARYYMQRGELTWGAYLGSLRGPKSFAVWRLSDLPMVAAAIGDALRVPVRRLRRRIGRPKNAPVPASVPPGPRRAP